ncbi:hypothetical protein COV04_03230 [Candidatus Uhrbacteria bacterium CG10_big_fil_rev_8_21_14_0_10_48_11]|uniref:Response regulatory domain-containing protein n=1 Tax=Candidatus Uhrbacteria bacterium CG10_big_fil_rev_8_21_14_0_10_48_11 TaxID=1975037 RepID=A0A2M8LE93_9BACT|nr:MAG: hypothetical protein COV04_03230 [Candidatus Uhrbacteria bacterium CG10_big_fil_rev_8_21_14_0_10_48_11]
MKVFIYDPDQRVVDAVREVCAELGIRVAGVAISYEEAHKVLERLNGVDVAVIGEQAECNRPIDTDGQTLAELARANNQKICVIYWYHHDWNPQKWADRSVQQPVYMGQVEASIRMILQKQKEVEVVKKTAWCETLRSAIGLTLVLVMGVPLTTALLYYLFFCAPSF